MRAMFWFVVAACGGSPEGGVVDLPTLVVMDLKLIFADMSALVAETEGLPDPQGEPQSAPTDGLGSCVWTWTMTGTPFEGSFAAGLSVPCGGAAGRLQVEVIEGGYTGSWQSGFAGVSVSATGGRTSTATLAERAANSSFVLQELSLTLAPTEGTYEVLSGFLKMTYLGYGGGARATQLTVTNGVLLGTIEGGVGQCLIQGTVEAPTVTCGE